MTKFLAILTALLLFSSCSDENINQIINNQRDTIPMWPQQGYDGRHTGNPFSPKVTINPVQNGIIDWIDTLQGIGQISRTIQSVDALGNIYFMGYGNSQSLYKLSPSGEIIWQKGGFNVSTFSGFSFSADERFLYLGANNVFLCIDSSGNTIWSVNQPAYNTKAAIGRDGTIYVTLQNGPAAITSAGSLKWQYNTPNGLANYPSIDIDENVYVLSNSHVIKLDKNGNFLWSYDYQTPGDNIGVILIDGFRNLYFIQQQSQLVSLDGSGNFRWIRDTLSNNVAPALSSSNRIYASFGKYLHCLNKEGDILWSTEIMPSGMSEHVEAYLAVDSDDNVYYITEHAGSVAASINKNGIFRWYCQTVNYPMLGGPVLSPLGRLVFRPKHGEQLISIK